MDYDVTIIGAGPGGYVAALRAAQLGQKVALVEKQNELGGTCLNIGCIPSKVLLESSELFSVTQHRLNEHGIEVGKVALNLGVMMQRKEKVVKELVSGIRLLMKKNKIAVCEGWGSLIASDRVRVSSNKGTEEFSSQSIVLATGSIPVELPFMPFDNEHVVSSTEALSFKQVPKHLVVIGAGAIGLELGSVWCRLGARVTIIELLPKIAPNSDEQMAKMLQRSLKQQGMEFYLECQVTGAKVKDSDVTVAFKDSKGKAGEILCDKVLVAVGRKSFSEKLGIKEIGVVIDERGRVEIDDHFRTNIKNIYAIGDLIKGPMLAHKAAEEGMAVAEILSGKAGHVNYETIPGIIYTWPELAEVGLSEEQAKKRGIEYRVGKYFFKANGRAKTMGEEEGMVKLLADAKTDKLIGAHIVGPRASDMIAELVMAMEFSGSAKDVARTVHAHPTLSEIIKEAALAVSGQPLHG